MFLTSHRSTNDGWFGSVIFVEMHISPSDLFNEKCCLYIYIYIYRRYHAITDVYTTALLLTKPSSDDDSGFSYGFGTEASLPQAQSAPAVSHDTTRLCQIVVALWDCQIYANAVRALS